MLPPLLDVCVLAVEAKMLAMAAEFALLAAEDAPN
jgi:hypothetical protein